MYKTRRTGIYKSEKLKLGKNYEKNTAKIMYIINIKILFK